MYQGSQNTLAVLVKLFGRKVFSGLFGVLADKLFVWCAVRRPRLYQVPLMVFPIPITIIASRASVSHAIYTGNA